MDHYVVERTLQGVGDLSGDELREISQKSNGVLAGLGNEARWVELSVTDTKLYCVCEGSASQKIEEHARQGEFPYDRASPVRTVIDPGIPVPAAVPRPSAGEGPGPMQSSRKERHDWSTPKSGRWRRRGDPGTARRPA